MNFLSLNIIARLFFYKSPRGLKMCKKKKELLKNVSLNFLAPMISSIVLFIYKGFYFLKHAENHILRSKVCRTLNEEYAIYRYVIKLYNLISICILYFLANIIHSLHYREGNMIVLEVKSFVSRTFMQ